MERPSWAPGSIDLERPSAARIYDYCLGGWHNFAADRATAEQTIRLMPELPRVMRSNRSFLRRAVQFCLGAGVRQFLDLGSGIPTVGNVHEVAQRVDPRARVVYVDVDPVAVAHSQAILADTAGAAAILADLRDPERILADEQLRGLLDLDRPVAVLMVAVLHFVPDSDDPAGIVARYRSATAPGSYLALSHATFEGDPDRFASAKDQYERAVTPVTLRSRDEIAALFAGFDLVEPGLVRTPLWRPESPDDVDDDPERGFNLAGVGRKR